MFFVFVSEISCTSTKIVFKIITILVELESYSEIKDINSIKSWVYDLGGGGYGAKLGIFLFGNAGFMVFCGVTLNCLPGSAS